MALLRPENLPDLSAVLDDAETFRRYGYHVAGVSPVSHQRVAGRCTVCGELFTRIRRNVNTNTRCLKHARSRSTPEAVAKRHATMLEKYGSTGLPVDPRAYGTAERELAAWVEAQIEKPTIAHKQLKGGGHLDITIESKALAIEYCGLHWHHELSKHPRRRNDHYGKMLKAKALGLRLVTIFEDEWKLRRRACEGFLLAILGISELKVWARRCEARLIPPGEAAVLMNAEHVQGASRRAALAAGLFYEGRMVGAMTFAPHHRGSTDTSTVVLDRLCFAKGVQVVGGAGKLLAVLRKEAYAQGFRRLISWSDNRWSEGSVYKKLGFTQEADLPPDYSYVLVSKPRARMSKQSQRKSAAGCPEGMTELEWATKRGLARIWDCGKQRWVMALTP
jgi:hypothetical protein